MWGEAKHAVLSHDTSYAEPKPKNLSFFFKAGRGRGRDAKNWKGFWFWTRPTGAPRGEKVWETFSRP